MNFLFKFLIIIFTAVCALVENQRRNKALVDDVCSPITDFLEFNQGRTLNDYILSGIIEYTVARPELNIPHVEKRKPSMLYWTFLKTDGNTEGSYGKKKPIYENNGKSCRNPLKTFKMFLF